MTQQEFIKKKVEIAANQMFPTSNEHETKMLARQEYKNGMCYGLTKGLEIGKEFAEWVGFNYNQESDGWYFMFGDDTKTYTTDELLTIFLTEKYGNNG